MNINAIQPDGPGIAIEGQAFGEQPVNVTPEGAQPAEAGSSGQPRKTNGEWWEDSDPGEPEGSCWTCSQCKQSIGLSAMWIRWFQYCPFCGAKLNTEAPGKFAQEHGGG